MPQPAAAGATPSGFSAGIQKALPGVVKVYGAGIAGERGYGTGVIVSAEGHVVTVLSLLIEASDLRVVAHDGHVHSAEVLYRDEYRQLALLKLARQPVNLDTTAPVREQMTPADFAPPPMDDSKTLLAGEWILVLGNAFRVAEGEEAVSVMKGVVSGRSLMDAVRETQDFPYRGDIVLIDAISSNVGSPGSAVVDLDGRWVGLVGKQVTSRLTNTYLNYAYPIEEIDAFVRDALSSKDPTTRPAVVDAGTGYHGIKLTNIGYRKRLPFVLKVAPGSPAETAGVRADDLVISANGRTIPQARAFTELCERLHPGDELSLIIKRGDDLLSIRIVLTEAPE